MKIDIDNDQVEWDLVMQILQDVAVSSLIDELYFEHHVEYSPLEMRGWLLDDKIMNITESYQVFTNLRKAGIRARSWV